MQSQDVILQCLILWDSAEKLQVSRVLTQAGTSRTVRRRQRHLLSTPVNTLRLRYIRVIGPFCDYPITNIQILSNIVSVRVNVRVSGVFTGEPDEKYKQ